jgi:hypothetical protein
LDFVCPGYAARLANNQQAISARRRLGARLDNDVATSPAGVGITGFNLDIIARPRSGLVLGGYYSSCHLSNSRLNHAA